MVCSQQKGRKKKKKQSSVQSSAAIVVDQAESRPTPKASVSDGELPPGKRTGASKLLFSLLYDDK